VETWIEFGRGPLFRLAFSLMVLGLLRIVVLTLIGIVAAYRRNPDRIVPWKTVVTQTFCWLAPATRIWRGRPLYSVTSFLFHIGVLAVPLFLPAHIRLWRNAAGIAWPGLPYGVADFLTLITIAAALGLLLGRALPRGPRALSRTQDYLWPPLLMLPFATGYLSTHAALTPKAYQWMMLAHIYSANLIMAMLPFSKIAHCVLAPLSQAVTAVSWKFVPGAGERVAATLGHGEFPDLVAHARAATPSQKSKETCAR